MKRISVFIIWLITIGNAGIAQVPTEKSLLWEISGNGLKAPSYLYGTIHLMCPDDIKVTPVITSKFNTTKQLYLELDLDDPNMMSQLMKMMLMTDTSTISSFLPSARFDSISNIFKSKTGFPLEMMNKAKPMLLTALIYPSLLGCQPASWEQTFQQMAAEKSMELKGLEELSEQAKVFDKIPYKVQAEMLAKTLLNLDSAKQAFTKILDLYKAKDINGMQSVTTADEDFGQYEGILLTNRNNNWIPIIATEAKKVPTFFAVGAGHLGGPNGLVNLLRKQGFTVKAVSH